MELVYLWVEGYKNIKKQGFNFSPRFRCEYDEKNNGLNIIDKEETGEFYPKNFFGDNINVTAIVGENGSGKSSILSNLNETISYNDKNLVIFKLNDKLYCNRKCVFNKNIEILEEEILLGRKNRYLSIITHSCDFLDNEFFLDRELSIYKEIHPMAIKDYDTDSLSEKNIQLDLNYLNYLSFVNKLVFIMLINKESQIFSPISYKIIFSQNKLFNKLFDILLYYPLGEDDFLNNKCRSYINKLILEKDVSYIISFYFYIKRYLSDDKIYESLAKLILEEKYIDIKELYLSEDEEVVKNEFIKIYKKEEEWYHLSMEIRNVLNNLFQFDIFSKMIIELFDMDLSEKIRNYSELSLGEREFLLTESLVREKLNSDNILLLLDEIDSFYHPNWSKDLINNLIQILSKNNVHIVISSHSPFILSDIPKENVIFLEKGKQVYPFDDGKQTFGANIHTLLSHGFFMKDGLMGKFAKEKINGVYRFLTDEESNIKTKEEAQNIISLIGEPLIQKQIEDIYNRKFQIKSKDEIIQELQNKIAELEKKSK